VSAKSAKSAKLAKSAKSAKSPVSKKSIRSAKPVTKESARSPSKQPASSEQILRRFAPLAKALPAGQVLPCRIDLKLALHNVQVGISNLQPATARLRKELSALPIAELMDSANLCAALLYADEQIAEQPSKAQNLTDLARLRQLRGPLLQIAEGLAALGLLPDKKVRAIRTGSGALDHARDGVALAELYRASAAALAGKHPFTPAYLDEIAELGERLTRDVTPRGAKRKAAPGDTGVELRNRLYTLLVRRHADLRRAGYYLFGEAVADKVPGLQAGRVVHRVKKTAPAPAPAPAPS